MTGLSPYKGIWPTLNGQVFVAAGARIIGDVTIGNGSGIWFNTVVRGDDAPVRIGCFTNIQDGSVIHVQDADTPTIIGDYVTAGHNVILHGCTIADNCLIGMGAIVMSGAKIGANCIVGAGTIIGERKVIPAGSLVVGAPGRIIRTVSDADIAIIRESALIYHEKALDYIKEK